MKFASQRQLPIWPLISLLFLLVLRLAWLNAYTLNSDEAQHAHVAWAWTQGLLTYRAVFDNHGPLFGWLHSPLLKWLDNRPDASGRSRGDSENDGADVRARFRNFPAGGL